MSGVALISLTLHIPCWHMTRPCIDPNSVCTLPFTSSVLASRHVAITALHLENGLCGSFPRGGSPLCERVVHYRAVAIANPFLSCALVHGFKSCHLRLAQSDDSRPRFSLSLSSDTCEWKKELMYTWSVFEVVTHLTLMFVANKRSDRPGTYSLHYQW